MSYTLNVEPDVMHRAESYALRKGTTLDALLRAYLLVVSRDECPCGTPVAPPQAAAHPSRRRVRIGSMREEISLPEGFDRAFEQLDAQVAATFGEMP